MSKLQPNNIAKFKQQMKNPVVRLPRKTITKIASSFEAVRWQIGAPDFVYTEYSNYQDHRRFSLRK
jgi:hypothetical protein